ncbi:MAG: hypothetical protein M1817_005846 [Caeruleum heppii]|nr:MAG: hypothetical protein M1817_005846 [Caeruleum heppii]
MASALPPSSAPLGRHHKRTPSSVLKSIVTSRNHKTTPSTSPTKSHPEPVNGYDANAKAMPLLPADHPASHAPLGELMQNQLGGAGIRASPRRAHTEEDQLVRPRGLHKKTLSSISLSTLAKGKDKEGKSSKDQDLSGMKDEKRKKPKKAKSQTNLGALLSRPKSSRGLKDEARKEEGRRYESRDKENRTPPQSAEGEAPPPIWAQFASQAPHSLQPERRRDLDHEISLYTPTDYSPSKQRNFYGLQQPTLGKRGGDGKRPAGMTRPTSNGSSSSLKEALSGVRRTSQEWIRGRRSGDESRTDPAPQRSSTENAPRNDKAKNAPTLAQRGTKVMAAVAAFNGKTKAEGQPPAKVMNQEEIEAAFEALLDSRNIPQNMRHKMRSLDSGIKADFIRQDKAENTSAAASKTALSTSSGNASETKDLPKRPAAATRAQTTGEAMEASGPSEEKGQNGSSPSKRSRPRSRTFTFGKGDKEKDGGGSPSKKHKTDLSGTINKVRPRGLSSSSSSKSLKSLAAATLSDGEDIVGQTKPAQPEAFVGYLRRVPKPEEVEVGKMHKLRLVLRNERVSWVDSFIRMGGMTEVVGLLERIMAVEWREEHEDALLHETLLCLKALCTTAVALQQLQMLESTLFPKLLGMLFDQERKGPSEFNTRGIIISLIFTHLSAANADNLAPRARTILSYLRDPCPATDNQPLGFITDMHQSRPYKVWCKEVSNVTKEVFWIFLHHTNIISMAPGAVDEATTGRRTYAERHFPQSRPPVPAAPYIGGVEWDATQYMALHLDLLNGLIASLPSGEERNGLRYELKVSGWEKVMGATLRTCKEKFYGDVHGALRDFIGAGREDGWEVRGVSQGLKEDEGKVRCSPKKAKEAKREFEGLKLPEVDLGGGGRVGEGWV